MSTAEKIDMHEAWLQAHAVDCKRYGMRLSPTSCQNHQAASPERCKGCERMTGEVPVIGQIKSSVALFPKRNKVKKGKEMAGKKPVRVCANCKETKPILGRGLCPACYHRARKAETGAKPINDQTKTELIEETMPMVRQPAVTDLVWLFDGEDEMRAKIEAAAKKERRDVRQQILFYLDQII